MIQNLQWPPIPFATFSLRGLSFEWQEDEPFVTHMLDGTVDTDLARQAAGFVNRIQRYGIQNAVPEPEWSLETINSTILQKLPHQLRGKFFRHVESSSQPPTKMPQAHTAPVPPGLAQAAGFVDVAADDPELPMRLATLTPSQWIETLRRWVKQNREESKKKAVSGPVWWYSLHALSMNSPHETTPMNFVGVWLGSYPCRLCRQSARIWVAGHPVPGWTAFEQWASDFHNYVTERKNR